MNNTLRNIIYNTAMDARIIVEDLAIKECKDPRIHNTLEGYCAIASGILFTMLDAISIRSIFNISEAECGACHVWIDVDDYIVDVTATQFRAWRNVPVLIEHSRCMQPAAEYMVCESFTNPNDVKRWQKKTNWPRKQWIRL